MAAQRRRPRLLALAAFAVLLLAQQAACATLDTDQAASDDGKVAGGKKAAREAAAPSPQPARKKPKATAAAAPAPAPATQDSSPPPSPSPSPETAASPAPAEAYCAPGSGCVLYRLIMKVEGAPSPLSQLDASNILAAVNSLAAPVVFEYRTQQPSAPGQLPAVEGATVQDPPVAKATGGKKKEARDAAGADATAANSSDVAALAAGTSEAAAAEATPAEAAAEAAAADAEAAAGGMRAAEQVAQRRLLRARRLGQGAVAAGGASSSRGLLQEAETANSCPKPKSQFEVQTKAECQEKCNLKVAGKTATVSPTTLTSASGGQLCCDCKFKKGTVPAPTEAAPTNEQPSATQPAAANGTGWWPASAITTPLTVDGAYVFADAQVLSYGADPLAIKLLEASNTGQLCSTINEYGVNCDGTAIMFQGTGSDIVFVRNTQTTPPSSSGGDGGLTTAAIVGIVVGSVVGLCAVAVLVHMVASCRRERIIERASKQRMERRAASYKAAADAAAAAAAENSRWRQNYSDRMAESMRRADEALGRQSAQAHGPSFVEAQDREFGGQASVQLSSKKSFGRSSSLKGSPKADDLEQSLDGSLMAGSELSSPQPSVTSSAKGGRSLKNLFGKK